MKIKNIPLFSINILIHHSLSMIRYPNFIQILDRFKKLYNKLDEKNNELLYSISRDINNMKKRLLIIQRFESVKSRGLNTYLTVS
jgi:hypothetical protein